MHKTVVGADCLLHNILKRAKFLSENKKLFTEKYPITPHLVYFLEKGTASIEDKQALEHYLLLDDTDI